jgi:curved DNA-binding protein CbpA
MPTHYDTLQVSPFAGDAVIKAAYRALARQYHPDHNPDNTEAEAMMKQINAAYRILSNTSSRAQYDSQQGLPVDTNDFDTDMRVHPSITDLATSTPTQQPPHFFNDERAFAQPSAWPMRQLIFAAAGIFYFHGHGKMVAKQ